MDSPVVVEVGRPSKLLGSDLRIDEYKLNKEMLVRLKLCLRVAERIFIFMSDNRLLTD